MKELIHQMQPTWNSCMTTCYAMLAGKDVSELIELGYHERLFEQYDELKVLDDLGIVAVPVSGYRGAAFAGFVYLIAIGSKNVEGASHQIILDCRWPDGYKVYDPAMGREDKYYYVPHYQEPTCLEPLAVPLAGFWAIDFRILECPALGVIKP